RRLADLLADVLPGAPLAWLAAWEGRAEGLSLEAWARLDAGRPSRVLAELALEAGQLARAEGEPAIALAGLAGRARLTPHGTGWRLDVASLRGQLNGQPLGLLDARLALDAGGQPRALGLATGALDLGSLSQSLALFAPQPWPEPLRHWLEGAPGGRVRALRGALALDAEEAPHWWIETRLDGLRWSRAPELPQTVPGVAGLDLRLGADPTGGWLALRGADALLDVGPLFAAPLALEHLDGALSWRPREAGGWRLESHWLQLASADLSGQARLALELPEAGAPLLDLRASLRDRGEPLAVQPYLPRGLLEPPLARWLDRALGPTRLPRIELLLRGMPADYPFRAGQGQFELAIDVADLRLDYANDWPVIEAARGRLRFENAGLAVVLDGGRILDSRIAQAELRIADLLYAEILPIEAQAEGPFSDIPRLLAHPPLREGLGALPERLKAEGPMHLDLSLGIPLSRAGRVAVDGRLSWPGAAALALSGTPLRLEALQGALRFDRNSLMSEGLEARLWGRPLALSIPASAPPPSERLWIEARALTPVATLAEQLPGALWSGLDGELDWRLRLGVRAGESRLDWRLDSALDAVAISLPAPLVKATGSARPLQLAGRLEPGRRLEGAGHWGEMALAFGQALDQPKSVPGVRLRLGAGPGEALAPPEASGLRIEGQVARLDLGAWRDWLAGRRSGSGALALGALDLSVGRLALDGWTLEEAHLQLRPETEGWALSVASEVFSGELWLPAQSGEPLGVVLNDLDLAAFGGSLASPGRGSAMLPALDVSVTGLRWKDRPLGRFEGQLRPDGEGWRLTRLRLEGTPLLAFDGSGAWRRAGGGRSQLQLRLGSANLGALLGLVGAGQAIEEAPLRAELDLSWPGAFGDFALARAEGLIELESGAGRLLALEPGVGRVLGFLNPGALGRRLAFDFSDLYAQGFAFEHMRGRLELSGGRVAYESFDIEGPSSRLILSGVTDLAARTFDQRLTLEPRLSSSVALASMVAGGPVLGAAVYLVDLAVGKPIDRFSRTRYRVTGSWDDPRVEPLGWEPLLEVPGEDPEAETDNYFLYAD
ncbi:MAG: TIGR02099 family protein, partial [Chromatiaceae bacterium]|nr:TIGR02099 family protein [Chromatiaceae bacterium]